MGWIFGTEFIVIYVSDCVSWFGKPIHNAANCDNTIEEINTNSYHNKILPLTPFINRNKK